MIGKSVIKALLPESVNRRLGTMRAIRRERQLARLPVQEAFDDVYRKGMWKQGRSLSGVGSEGNVSRQYIEFILAYAKKHNLHTVVDGGCGDFSIGSRLVSAFDSYTALDVSPYIVERNKTHFQNLMRHHALTFRVADMIGTQFPSGDLILIRQVLQHLTNDQIQKILDNLKQSSWRRALITEEVFDPENNENCNLDLPSHTVRTRTMFKSGVFIDRAPFNCAANRVAVFREHESGEVQSGLIVFELSQSR